MTVRQAAYLPSNLHQHVARGHQLCHLGAQIDDALDASIVR